MNNQETIKKICAKKTKYKISQIIFSSLDIEGARETKLIAVAGPELLITSMRNVRLF